MHLKEDRDHGQTKCLDNARPTSGARVNCTNGLIIDHAGVTRIVPTTTPYTPPTGIPGNTGAIGPQVSHHLYFSAHILNSHNLSHCVI